MTLLAVAQCGRGVVPPGQPVLRADDEGVLRGRAVFETLRVYGGRAFRLDAHLDRLGRSAERLDLPPIDREGLVVAVVAALGEARAPEAVLRLLWTPGPEGENAPTGLALVTALPAHLDDLRRRGLRAVSVPWSPGALLAGVKSTSYAANMAAQDEAARRGADDAILVGPGGDVLEAPTSNVWWREGRLLLTPPLDLPILAGVTRSVLAELAPAAGYEVVEVAAPLSRLVAADEVLLSSSVREVVGVIALDDVVIGDGKPGEAARELHAALRRLTGYPPTE